MYLTSQANFFISIVSKTVAFFVTATDILGNLLIEIKMMNCVRE